MSEQEGCLPCVCACARGVRAKCEQFHTFFERLMLGHPSHEHAERTGYGDDPNVRIGHFDQRLPSP
eukprot:14522487-Alexandrium_andersonii.AAC.1